MRRLFTKRMLFTKRLLFGCGLLAATIAVDAGTGAQAQNYPWCAQYGRGSGGAMTTSVVTLHHRFRDLIRMANSSLPSRVRSA